MKAWRAIAVAAVLAAVAVILATAYLEAEGLVHLPWPGMAPQIGARFGPFRGYRLAFAGPYVEAVAGLLLQFLIGAVVVYTAPERMRRLSDAVAAGGTSLLRFFAIGVLLAFGLGAVAVLSAFYVHTAVLSFAVAGILSLSALVGWVALGLGLGRGLLRRAEWSGGSPLVALWVGTTLLYAAARLPFLSVAVMVLLALTATGAVLSTRFGGRRTWSLDPLREVVET
jgi:hypothetical protein